jgi:Spy/CpxP family protein refolding chaperone
MAIWQFDKILTMNKLTTIALAISLAGSMALPATAQMRMRGDYGHGSYSAVDITKLPDLKLTDEQITKLNALRNVYLLEIKPLRDRLYSKSIELKGLWLEQTPDHEKIALLQKETQILRDVMLGKVAAYRRETLHVLTGQQQITLESYKEKHGYGYGKGMQGQGGRGR